MARFFVTVEFYGVEAISEEEAVQIVRRDIGRLGIGGPVPEISAEEEW